MRLTFILPAIGKKPGQKYIGTWKMEPLTIAVLQGLMPKSGVFTTDFLDDRIEAIPDDHPTDAVAIPVETYTAKRAYQLADRFRARGIPVILGGYHVTLLPDEAARHADAIVIGNAEPVWQQLLADLLQNKLQPRYAASVSPALSRADRSIYRGKRYLPIGLSETGRGCYNHCDFCAIACFYRNRYYPRKIEDVVADIQANQRRYHFLVDDNLIADRAYARALFSALEPLKIKWAGQGTLSMARDRELLAAMKRSGCELILIGFESLNDDNLRQMKKEVNLLPQEKDELVQRIHDAGIGIYATFVFGYDHDTPDTIAETVRFAKKHKFYTAAFNHLLPWPGTALFERLRDEGRLLSPAWWLSDDYHYGELVFQPKQMSAAELSRLCLEARRQFARPHMVWRRGLSAMRRTSPGLWFLFWAMNLRLGPEVEQKMYVPLGKNLDEPLK